ncbi:MAG: GTPase Era [Desulfohalobiaceae bacterium]
MAKENPGTAKFGIVAIIGPPNAGKSTLLNSFLGQKLAIVTPKPQTTRNRISGILSQEEAQIVFLDTPGLHQSAQALNRHLVQSAWQALAEADLVLLVLDAGRYTKDLRRLQKDLGELQASRDMQGMQLAVVLNKTDQLRDKKHLLPVIDSLHRTWPGAEIFPASALQDSGTQEVLNHILLHLPPGPALYPEDQLSTLPLRFLASEIIREKLFLFLQQELPYSLAVQIEGWQEEEMSGLVLIHAVIYVSRTAHKPMVIGQKGQMLKKVGREARLELEHILGQQVHLELWVKVRSDWIKNQKALQELIPRV